MAKMALGSYLGTLRPRPGLPLHRQLYERLRELILDGTLARGARIPATRTVAADLGLSRNTVLQAVQQLTDEGYLTSRVGDGTYVNASVPEDLERPRGTAESRPSKRAAAGARLSARGRRIAAQTLNLDTPKIAPFVLGQPAVRDFPWETWRRIWRRESMRMDRRALLAYGAVGGLKELREQTATYLTTARGVRCTADQVVIVSSSQQGLACAAQVLLDPGDAAWIEEPGYLGARGALAAAGAQLAPVPVDDAGLRVAWGVKHRPGARLAYVTPSHQFPLGSVMSLERRFELLEWATQHGSWILEDDYDSEFRYVGRPLTALQGLDQNDRVIYVGTFTKVMYPSLRLGYVVPPPHLVDAFLAARNFMDRHSPTLPQATLAGFFRAGHFTAHLRAMRARYRMLQQVLVESLQNRLADEVSVRDDPAGLHLVVELRQPLDDEGLCQRLHERGIFASPLSRYYLGRRRVRGLLLGYAALTPPEIRSGVKQLERVIRESSLTGATRSPRPSR